MLLETETSLSANDLLIRNGPRSKPKGKYRGQEQKGELKNRLLDLGK